VQNAAPGDRAAQIKLTALREAFEKQQPGSPLAGYIVFRDMSAKYSVELQEAKGEKLAKVQDAWRDSLKDFVQKYPTAEDAPDAALQVGMVSEFMGKESDAKEWYGKLAQNYAQHPYAKKAQGALRRINLEGQPFALEGPTIDGRQFNIAQAQGKTVVVYYWASWSGQSASDFKRLAELNKTYADKGLLLVTVNLDDSVAQAKEVLDRERLPAITLHTQGGLECPLAAQYGIMVLPNIFVVDKTGKCTSRTAQMSNLEDEVKKAMEK
jgi:thiol-disulfide isomerase/thioredoxin